MTRYERRDLLKKDSTLFGFFNILCSDRESTFAIWLDGDNECSYNYAHLYKRVYAVAKKVKELNFGSVSGRVGIAVDTNPRWAQLFWGLLAAGREPLLLDPSLPDRTLAYLMSEAGADALICAKKRDIDAKQLSPDELLDAPEYDISNDEPESHRTEWADRVAVCTSGTTATSRVFVYDGAGICCQVIGFIDHQPYPCLTCAEEGPIRTLSFLPLNHIFGLMTNIITTPFQQFPQIYLKDRAPQTILSTCRKTKVQMILAVPMLANGISSGVMKNLEKQSPINRAAFKLMQKRSLDAQKKDPRKGLELAHKIFSKVNANLFGDSLIQIVVGGAHIPAKHAKLLNSLGYAVTVGYGMTEIAITSYENKIDLESRMTSSVGLPLPICEYKLIPDGDDENRGELLVRSKAMHIGRLTGGKLVAADVDKDGYFATGDVVRLGDEGRMWIEGRVKDMIIGPSGENVYPDEIEDAFAAVDAFGKYTVLGTSKDEKEYITLVVSVGENINDADFIERLTNTASEANASVRANSRVNRFLVTAKELPVAATIKVRRGELAKDISENPDDYKPLTVNTAAKKKTEKVKKAKAGSEREELTEVRKIIAETLSLELAKVGADSDIIADLGGDSLMTIEMAIKIEEKFGVTIPEEQYAECLTARKILDKIDSIRTGNVSAPEKSGSVTPITRFEDSPEYKNFEHRLATTGERNPYFVCHESPLYDVSLMNGEKEVLNFGSYNYVGMSGRPETIKAAKAAADKYGTSASGSRLLGGEKKIHEALEQAIAEWKHAEDAVVLVGGHSTNVTVVGNFCGKNDLILYDALAHNSVHEGCRLSDSESRPFPHNDTAALDKILSLCRNRYEKVLIVVEGAYSMDGDIAPIPEYVRIKKKYGCFLMVDEAHSACVLGKTGGGVDEHFGLAPDDIDIKMGTLSKGLGTCGGYIAGKRCLVEYLRYNVPGFVFSVGLSPVLAAASLEAIRLLREDPSIIERLHSNIKCFAEEAKKHRFDICLAGETAILPVLVGKDEDAYALSVALSDKGVFVPPAVFPAVPKNKARLRFCVISEHKPEQIARALDILDETAKEMGIELPRI